MQPEVLVQNDTVSFEQTEEPVMINYRKMARK